MKLNRQHRRLLIALNLAMFTGVILLVASGAGLFTTWRTQSTDFLFKAKTAQASSRVGIVAIDDRTLLELAGEGRVFNWRRSLYAQVISALAQAGARVVVLDVLFDTPAPDDAALAAVLAANNVVLPVAGEMPASNAVGELSSYEMLVPPTPLLAGAAANLGHVMVHPDGDGTVRRVQLAISAQGQEVQSLALVAAARYLRRPAPEVIAGTEYVSLAGRNVPVVDGRSGMLINYQGPPYQAERPSAFPVLSFVDVLRGRADLSVLKDRVVLIGVMAVGYADDYWTPPSVGRKMSGVEIHAHASETILRPALLHILDPLVANLTILLLALLAGLAAYRFRSVGAAVAALALMLGYVVVSFILFDRGVLPNVLYALLAPALSFASVMAYRVRFIEFDQRATKRLLSGYLSPSVMVEVLKEPEKLRLSGDKRVMTVLFSDIRGFTTYSEKIDPEKLVSLLNDYLTEMSAVVFEYEGVVDKYIGDGMMTFWGAPVIQPDQARRACLAALGMMRRLAALNAKWAEADIPSFDIGIGINTGEMAVGNMGSLERFSYTVIGDAVNLASRLEGLTKQYGTHIVVSEATLRAAGDGFVSRVLGPVAVKGKREAVVVYELMAVEGTEADDDFPREMLRLYDEGMRLSAERKWQEACEVFQGIVDRWQNDGPSQFQLHRCLELLQHPEEAETDGVYVAKTK